MICFRPALRIGGRAQESTNRSMLRYLPHRRSTILRNHPPLQVTDTFVPARSNFQGLSPGMIHLSKCAGSHGWDPDRSGVVGATV